MSTLAAVRAALIVVAIATPLDSHATTNTAAPKCAGAFDALANSSADDWQPPQRIFGDSLLFMIPSAVTVLTATQYIKYMFAGNPDAAVFSAAFPLTLVNDTLTTGVSHWISTSKHTWLKRIFEGRRKNGDVGFWRRVGANTVLGTTLISMTWMGAGLDVGVEQVCGALGLCAVVYPTLQVLKDNLYKRLPLRQDVQAFQQLEGEFPSEVSLLRDIADHKAQSLGIDVKDAEYLVLTALEAVVTSRPIENELSTDLVAEGSEGLWLAQVQLFELETALNGSITSEGEAATPRSLIEKQRKLRRQILTELGAMLQEPSLDGQLRAEIEAILSFGEGVDPGFSVALHKVLSDRLRGYYGKIAFASAVDMSIAIGFFGGVCLEAVNVWAKTGEAPEFFSHITWY